MQPLNYSSPGSFLENGSPPSDSVVTNGAMFKSSPIVQNGSDVITGGTDLRKSSSGSLAGKIAAANGYTLGSDAVLRNGHHRNSSTESVKSLNSKNFTLKSKISKSPKETESEQMMLRPQNGISEITLKSLKEQGILTTKMQTLTSTPTSDTYNSNNANGKSNSHHYTESDSSNSRSPKTNDPCHKQVDVDLTSYSVIKYVSDPSSKTFFTISICKFKMISYMLINL